DVPAGIDSSDPRDMIISYDPPDHDDYRFGYEQVITVRVEASDAASGALDYSYSFTTIEITQAPNVRVNRATDGDHLQSRMCMDHSGKKVYVVWQKDGGIWFSSSDDRGETFLEEIKISPDDSGTNENPAIAVDEPGNIYVIWQSKKDAETSDLYFCRRLKGEDFEAAKIPVDTAGNESDQMFPAIKAKSSGSVFIAWVNRNDNEGVYYSRADKDSGASLWSAPVIHRVDDASEALPQYPDVGIDSSGHNVIIAWSAEKGGTRNIYFNAFEYVAKDKVDAKLYAADIQINDAAVGGSCDRPRIGNRNNFNGAGSKPGIAVVWENTLAEDNKDIYLDKSVDGAAWGADIRVNDDETQDPALQEAPQVAVDANGDMFLAWADKASGNWDIYSTYSLDAGATFHDVVKFNDNSGSSDQYGPSLFLSANGKNICVSWTDERDGNADIYFGRNTITDEETCMNVDKDVDATVSADASSSIARTQAVIPALALETDTSISVARIYCPPGFIFGKANLNKFVHFGPSGTRFKKNVTIKIPYTLEELAEAGLSSSSPLTIYYYNPKTKAWELVPGTTQDSLNQLVMASVDHFSTFALAEGEAVTSASGGGGGGGGGGCFIATAAFGSYDSPEVKALRIFRDRHLLSSGWGREFVKFYYAHSPSLAEFIKDKPAFKRVVRLFLKPVAAAAAMIPAQ
ncbi:MAG TPA: hypothetical protein PK562_05425, partial [Candidatus Omnitrophota bacterium]|nr:hypothetical protein [Candidatus Omnitrophota bacterium]